MNICTFRRFADKRVERFVIIDAGGIRRRIRVFRLPDDNDENRIQVERRINLRDVGDNALYVCLTQEDGHLAWSSPIYIFK